MKLELPSLFTATSKNLVGLDIGSYSVKLVELARAGSGYRLESYAIEPLPANAVTDHDIREPELVAKVITHALKRGRIKSDQVVLAIPASAAITKVIEISGDLEDDEIEQQIRYEADQYVPYPIEEVALDFQLLGPSPHNPDQNEVLLAACRSENIESRVSAVELAGLVPAIVDVETYALENVYRILAQPEPHGSNPATVLLLNIGAADTLANVLHDGETVYTRNMSFGSQQLTEDIMRHFSMSAEQAEQARLNGKLPAVYRNDILPAFLDDLAQQISRTLQLYFSTPSAQSSVDTIMVGGGGGTLPGLAETVRQQLQIPTLIANPFANMRSARAGKKEALAAAAPCLLLATGLALRAFDGG